jgi:hypothetical protein
MSTNTEKTAEHEVKSIALLASVSEYIEDIEICRQVNWDQNDFWALHEMLKKVKTFIEANDLHQSERGTKR